MSAEDDMQEISPEEIKRIRKSLGLSQAEAGRLLGGGPSAFAKYEKGSVRPSASLLKMLSFLRARPGELEALTTGRENVVGKAGTTPFEITNEHVSALRAREFSVLVGKLLSAEAQESDIPLDGIHVSYEISAPDGGEDARIEWRDGPPRTGFLPSSLCQFQLKTGEVSLAKAGKEVLDSRKQLKPMIREVLEKGGFYIMLCSRDYSKKAIQDREGGILENIRKHLPEIEETRVQFRDSGQIAAWVASRPPAALWLLKKTRPTLANPSFGNWDHWSRRAEHSGAPWVEDPRLPDFREKLLSIARTPKGAVRVTGPYGAGKSRLALEAFRPTQEEETSGVRLSDLVLYAVESESGSSEINKLAWDLVNSKRRSVLVVDRCSEETRADLGGIVRHSDSKVSLVTINDEVPRHAEKSEDTLVVGRVEHSFIEKVVRSVDPSISELLDRRRIADFSDGNILCARVISESWSKTGLKASADDETLVKKFIGRDDPESDHMCKAAMLISAFGEVPAKPADDHPIRKAVELGGGISIRDFHAAVEKLKRRGTVSRYGDSIILRPEFIAIKLAALQWESWYEILDETFPEELIEKTAARLAMINTTDIASKVALNICRNRELWTPCEKLEKTSKILVPLAETDARGALEALEKILDPVETVGKLSGSARSNIVEALSKIAFPDDDTFEDAARLLFVIEAFENKNDIPETVYGDQYQMMGWAEAVELMQSEPGPADRSDTPRYHFSGELRQPIDCFRFLFPPSLAETAAGPERRLRVIDELMDEFMDDDTSLSIIAGALLEGAKPASYHRTTTVGGPEVHGSRAALESWRPKTVEEFPEFLNYVKKCADLLVSLAKRSGSAGDRAREELGNYLGEYIIRYGLTEEVEKWTEKVADFHTYWPEAIGSLEKLLMNHSARLPDPVKDKVKALVSRLEPEDLEDRVRFLVTEMPDGYLGREKDGGGIDYDEMLKSQKSKLERLADDLLARESELKKFVPQLSRGEHRTAREFGMCLAEKAPEPLSLKTLITDAVAEAPGTKRDFELLIGYIQGLARRHPEELEKFKKEAAKSRVFAPVLPTLTLCTGIGSEDVTMVIDALESNLILPRMMRNWGYGGQLSRLRPDEVAPLFDFMLEKKDPLLFSEAVFLMRMYAYGREERLESLRPQLLLAAEYPSVVEKPRGGPATLHETEGTDSADDAGSREPDDEPSSLLDGENDDSLGSFEYMNFREPNTESAGHYKTLMIWILSKGTGDPDARKAAVVIARQILREEYFSPPTEDMIRDILPCLLSKFADLVWPTLGRAIAENGSEWKTEYFLSMLGQRAPHRTATPILSLSENTLFGWCNANPEIGPAFAAKALPVAKKLYETESYRVMHVVIEAVDRLRAGEEKITDDEIHPTARRLLDEFGKRGDVREILESNVRDFCGGYRDYIILFREPLRSIADHEKGPVRRWVGKMLRKVNEQIEEIRMQDKDRGIDWR